jgi:zinc protease
MKNILSFSVFLGCLMFIYQPGFSQNDTKEINYEGLKIIFKKTPKQVITASLFIKGGTANVSESQQGLEVIALNLALDGGTKTLNKDAFAAKADKLGTSFAASGSPDYSTMTMTCLKENFSPSWEMFNSAIFEPAMDESEFNVLKDQMIAQARQRESDPDTYLRKMAADSLFGGTDYAKIPDGTPETLEKITLADVKKY